MALPLPSSHVRPTLPLLVYKCITPATLSPRTTPNNLKILVLSEKLCCISDYTSPGMGFLRLSEQPAFPVNLGGERQPGTLIGDTAPVFYAGFPHHGMVLPLQNVPIALRRTAAVDKEPLTEGARFHPTAPLMDIPFQRIAQATREAHGLLLAPQHSHGGTPRHTNASGSCRA